MAAPTDPHFLEAEKLLELANNREGVPQVDPEGNVRDFLLAAVGHATLALAAATALRTAPAEGSVSTGTDAEDDADEEVRAGSLSPTGDMDARALAAWLRRVPLGSSLTDIDGDRWYRITGADSDPARQFPAIACADGRCVDNIDDHDDMLHARRFAPFTVLAVGEADRRHPELADVAVGVGAVSPTDPAALGAWLRDLPDGTILRGNKGIGWQLGNITVTSFLLPPSVYRALTSMAGESFKIAEGSPDLDKLEIAAPFTVLAVGDGEDGE